MTQNNSPDTLASRISGLIGDSAARETARETAKRDQQNKVSNENLGDALRFFTETFDWLSGDDRAEFSRELAGLAKKAHKRRNAGAIVAKTNPSDAHNTDRSAAHQLRPQLALLDTARATKPSEVAAAVRFLKSVVDETFGQAASQPGVTENQLVFSGTTCTIASLVTALELDTLHNEVLGKVDELKVKANQMANLKFDASQPWQHGQPILTVDDFNNVADIIEALDQLKHQVNAVVPPVKRRAIALGTGSGDSNN